MKKTNLGSVVILIFFQCLSVHAQNYPANPQSQPQVVVPSPQPYTTYPAPAYGGPPVVVQSAPVAIPSPSVVVPQGVVYMAPSYPAPAVGFVWVYHPRFGWGWRHPVHGWHRGWR